MTKKKYYDVIDGSECLSDAIYDSFTKKGGYFHIRGHDLEDEKSIASIKEAIEDSEECDIKIIRFEKKEQAFSCFRYFEGQDAKDEGYGYWVDYSYEWKKGLGKCTEYRVFCEKVKEVLQ